MRSATGLVVLAHAVDRPGTAPSVWPSVLGDLKEVKGEGDSIYKTKTRAPSVKINWPDDSSDVSGAEICADGGFTAQ